MGKLEYIDALKKALAGLPPDVVAKTLAFYEQSFIDGLAAGRTEDEISADLGEPRKIAMTLRANSHLKELEHKPRPFNLVRTAISATGLAVFNLFMIVPAAVFASLLIAMYACAFGFYVGGIAVTASGMAGVNELALDGPLKHWVVQEDGDRAMSQTRFSINQDGITFTDEHPPAERDQDTDTGSKVIEKAEMVAGHGIHISTDMDAESRTTQSIVGLCMVVGGIAIFLVGLVVTRFSALAAKRYFQMNVSLLKGS